MPEVDRKEWIKSKMDPSEDRLHRYRAKRLRFLINGDKHFAGINYALNTEKIRSFDALLNDLTCSLSMDHLKLCKGVRYIFSIEGAPVQTLTDFLDGQTYVCSSTDTYIVTDYRISNGMLNWLVRNSACISSTEKVRARRNLPRSPAPSARIQHRQSSPRPKLSNRFSASHDINHSNPNGTGAVDVASNGTNHNSQAKELNLNKTNSNSNNQQKITAATTPTHTRRHIRINNIDETSQNNISISNRANNVCKGPNVTTRSANKLPKTNQPSPKLILQQKQTPKRTEQSTPTHLPASPASIFGLEVPAKYDIGQPIGDGHFSVVYCCMNKETQEFCALKLIDKLKCRGKDDMIYNEVKILKRLNHPNIVKLIEEFDYPKQLYLILELVQDGDLFDAISNVTKFGEVDVATMMHNLSSALNYLHNQNIVHRDIKPENLLISVQEDGSQSVKLADFGLAVEVTDRPLYNVCGTAFYVSPEMLNETGYSFKVDVWSTGVICFILLCGYPPFTSENENNQDELFDAILAGDFRFAPPYWSKISQQAKCLIKCMLTVDPEKRYTAEQVFNNPWTQGTSSNFDGIDPMNISRRVALQTR